MSVYYKILGQSAPSATTNTNVYTVPSGRQALVSSIIVANRGGSAASYRVALRPSGATISNEHYIAYDVAIAANDTTTISVGISLSATDIITVYSSNTSLSFSAVGAEIY